MPCHPLPCLCLVPAIYVPRWLAMSRVLSIGLARRAGSRTALPLWSAEGSETFSPVDLLTPSTSLIKVRSRRGGGAVVSRSSSDVQVDLRGRSISGLQRLCLTGFLVEVADDFDGSPAGATVAGHLITALVRAAANDPPAIVKRPHRQLHAQALCHPPFTGWAEGRIRGRSGSHCFRRVMAAAHAKRETRYCRDGLAPADAEGNERWLHNFGR